MTSSGYLDLRSNHQIRFIGLVSLITQVMLIEYFVSYSQNEIKQISQECEIGWHPFWNGWVC